MLMAGTAIALQRNKPVGPDVSRSGDWDPTEGTDLWDELDDGVSADDGASDVESDPVNGNTTQEKSFTVTLSGVTDPVVNTGHEIKIRARKGSSGGATVKMKYILKDGDSNFTNIRTTTSVALTDTWTSYGVTLTEAQAAMISDYSDMRIKIEAVGSTTNNTREMWVSNIQLVTPDAEVPSEDECDGTDDSGGHENLVDDTEDLATEMTEDTQPAEYCIEDKGVSNDHTAPEGGLPIQAGDILNGEGTANPYAGTMPSVRVIAHATGQYVIEGQDPEIDNIKIQDLSLFYGHDQPDPEDTDQVDDHDDNSGTPPLLEDDGDCTSNEDDYDQDSDPSNDDDPGDNDVNDCGAVIHPGDGWTVLRSRIAEGDTMGIRDPGSDLLVENSVLNDNGTQYDAESDNDGRNNGSAAAIKGGAQGAFVVIGSHVYDNNQGVWCDIDCQDNNGVGFVVENSKIEDNCSFGIHYENTYENESTTAQAEIIGNEVQGNNWCQMDLKADIGIVSAENATVSDNVMGTTTTSPDDVPDLGFIARDRNPDGDNPANSDNPVTGSLDSLNSFGVSPVDCYHVDSSSTNAGFDLPNPIPSAWVSDSTPSSDPRC
jgi:hypothetical protein